MNNCVIYLSFRFHGNFYHSYRGDTPDEMGFGKDIRIIRHIIRVLDAYNRRGIPVKGTWDFENYFSLETIMPAHCPDIIEDMKRRVRENGDEIQIMSYNNGMVSAHTAAEFEAAIGRAVTNNARSGVKDLFGIDPFMVRPQEMMFTPGHVSLYRRCGIRALSLFYSAVPFNSFSNFVPPLGLKERFNPLTLRYPGVEDTMTLMPAYNTGDLIDNLTLRRWLKRLRRLQLKEKDPCDLLLTVDMDADDDFWYGIKAPPLDLLWSSLRGLEGLLKNIDGLDFLRFTTPRAYLESHPPVGEVCFGQDTADGSFDGYSSWAEKWENQQLWTGIERSRLMEAQTRRLMETTGRLPRAEEIEALLSRSFEERLRSLSTTHFGMASPIMNLTRLRTAATMIGASVDAAAGAFDIASQGFASKDGQRDSLVLMDCRNAMGGASAGNTPRAALYLVRLPLAHEAFPDSPVALRERAGAVTPCVVSETAGRRELMFTERLGPGERKNYELFLPADPPGIPLSGQAVTITADRISNGLLTITLNEHNEIAELVSGSARYGEDLFCKSGVTYGRTVRRCTRWRLVETATPAGGFAGVVRTEGEIRIGGREDHVVVFERELMLFAGVPYLYAFVSVRYPETRHKKYNRARSRRLQQTWDGRWREVMPCEIVPGIAGSAQNPLRVWKHNHCGETNFYDLDYGAFSRNRELDSVNNHVTNGWVAVTNGARGILLAQSAEAAASPAFCPLRTRLRGEQTPVYLNPFGTYYGKQLKYDTARSGLGRTLALLAADHLNSYAPSYNGRAQCFSLMIAPYEGDCPPAQITADAGAYAHPCITITGDRRLSAPRHREWTWQA